MISVPSEPEDSATSQHHGTLSRRVLGADRHAASLSLLRHWRQEKVHRLLPSALASQLN